ncbi:DUF3619 family protein [Noviherbaspirillum sp. Root189]|uniref:DUF3619 family protein n=1 Tax=Noviherbaspirillum sp. Root189 TaxID=1736487 RepID=UPI000708EB16|nr:DUF3619 family protein [Noviherbaspirillum sp. Root189]KRB84586.1 hypothetical protein ASE07_04095 [Noviherbaspirillum sp. Root189]
MNTREINFAYKVRHALNENLDNLPSSTTDRLASARKLALSRKKNAVAPLRAFIPQAILSGQAGAGFPGSRLSWLARMGVAVPLVVLVVGLTGMYQYEQKRRIADTAEIDAEVLSDELPLSAYLDHGFNAFLAKRGD